MIKSNSRKKAVLIQASGGYINTAISITQGLLLLPIYFKFISFSAYGYWVTIGSIVALLGIINFGLGSVVIQKISQSYAKKDFEKVGAYFVNGQILYFIIVILFLIIGYVLSFWLQNILSYDDAQSELFLQAYYLALIAAALVIISNSVKSFTQALLLPQFAVYSTIISRIIGIFLTIIMLYNNIGLLAIPIGMFITELLICLTNVVYAYKQYRKLKVKASLNKNIVFEYLNLSPYLFLLMVGDLLSNNAFPLIVTTFLGAEMTAAYTVTRKAITIILQALNVFNASLIAPFSNLVGEGNNEKIKNISVIIVGSSFFLGLITFGTYITTNSIFVSLWISEKVVLPQSVIFAMGGGALFYAMTRLFRSLLFGLAEFKFASMMVFCEGTVFIIMSLILIKFWGIAGVALASLLASFLIALVLGYRLVVKLQIKANKAIVVKEAFMLIFVLVFIEFVIQFQQSSLLSFALLSLVSIVGIALIEITINYKYFERIKFKKKVKC